MLDTTSSGARLADDADTPDPDQLRAMIARLAELDPVAGPAAGAPAPRDRAAGGPTRRAAAARRIELLDALERIKSAAAAAQARLTDAFAVSHRSVRGSSVADQAEAQRSIRAQVGLARRDSPHRGARHVRLAAVLVREMPRVLAALARGDTSEWRAQLIVQETRHLTPEQRAHVDVAIGDRLGGWGDRQTQREVRAWVCRLDPHGAAARAAKAALDRRVSIRPAPDSMTYLTALLPVKEGVSCYAALHRQAALANTSADDNRSRGQVMADELVRRVLNVQDAQHADLRPVEPNTEQGSTGPESKEEPAEASGPSGIMLHLVMTDRTLLDAHSEPAHLIGYGPLPAPLARRIARADPATKVWVRRLYTDPETGQLAATDARRRFFPYVARQFLTVRDQVCRTSYCGAPIAHADHTTPVPAGGATEISNGTGRCQTCNYVKEAPGWNTITAVDGTVTTSTPTGHSHSTRPPAPPVSQPWRRTARGRRRTHAPRRRVSSRIAR